MSRFKAIKCDNGVELVVNLKTGYVYATQSAYCRMAKINKNVLSHRMKRGYKGVQKKDLKVAIVHTAWGKKESCLINSCDIFSWLLKDNIDIAYDYITTTVTIYLSYISQTMQVKRLQKWLEIVIDIAQILIDKHEILNIKSENS